MNWSRGLFLDFQEQRKYSEWPDTMDPIRSKIVKEQLRQENILLYMFASTLKKTNKIWYDEIILGKGVHFNPQSVKEYILDIWYLSLLYFI